MAKAQLKALEVAKAEYQAELEAEAKVLEFQLLKAEYQSAMAAEFEKVAAPASAAEVAPKRKKVRIQFADAKGRSANGFLMGAVTGQIDQAMVEGKAQTGKWPTPKSIAILTGIAEKRVAEHIAWWRTNTFRGKGPLYL